MAGWLGTGVVLLALLSLGGLYVAAEFAILATRRSQLVVRAQQPGGRAAARLLGQIGDLASLEQTIATLQVGITVVSLGLGMYGEQVLAGLFLSLLERPAALARFATHGLASVLALTLLTFLHVVLGEVLPKSIALGHPLRTALWVETPLRITRLLAWPLVTGLTLVSRGLLHLLAARTCGEAGSPATLDEIQAAISESDAGGLLPPSQTRLLTSLMSFEQIPVHKVMVPRNRVTALPVGTGWKAVAGIIQETGYSRYPLHAGSLDEIVGYVHVKDLLEERARGRPLDLQRLRRPIPRISETASCTELMKTLRLRRSHMAVAVEGSGGTAGIVTLEDLLEEIFGDVQDEFDLESPQVIQRRPGVVEVRGECRLDEASPLLPEPLHARGVDTVAGLLLQELGRMARAGDQVQVGKLKLTVLKVERLAISLVRIEWEVSG